MFIPLKYNIRYLRNRPFGTIMTAGTFALVVAIFVIVMSLARGIEKSLGAAGDPLNVLIMRPGVQAEGQSSVAIERYSLIRAWPGIARDAAGEPLAAPEVIVLVNKQKVDSLEATNLQVRGVQAQAFKIRPDVKIVAGRMFRPGLREVIVSRRVARRFAEMNLGERPWIGRSRWTIVGIFDAGGSAFESEMWCDYREVMQEFNRTEYNTVVVRAVDSLAVKQLTALADADARIKLRAWTEEEYYKEQTKTAGPLKAFGSFLAVIMSVGACFAGMNTMYASVAGRVKEIGTLRILGYTPFSILCSFLLESISLSFIGGCFGVLLALPINGLATGTMNFQTFSEIVFNFAITPDLMILGLVFALLMGAIGGILPALSAARQPILSALRQV